VVRWKSSDVSEEHVLSVLKPETSVKQVASRAKQSGEGWGLLALGKARLSVVSIYSRKIFCIFFIIMIILLQILCHCWAQRAVSTVCNATQSSTMLPVTDSLILLNRELKRRKLSGIIFFNRVKPNLHKSNARKSRSGCSCSQGRFIFCYSAREVVITTYILDCSVVFVLISPSNYKHCVLHWGRSFCEEGNVALLKQAGRHDNSLTLCTCSSGEPAPNPVCLYATYKHSLHLIQYCCSIFTILHKKKVLKYL
jgi:hypothetical protein